MTDTELARQVEPMFSAMEQESEAFDRYDAYVHLLQHGVTKAAILLLYSLAVISPTVALHWHLSIFWGVCGFGFALMVVWISAQLILLFLEARTLKRRDVLFAQVDRLLRIHQVGEE